MLQSGPVASCLSLLSATGPVCSSVRFGSPELWWLPPWGEAGPSTCCLPPCALLGGGCRCRGRSSARAGILPSGSRSPGLRSPRRESWSLPGGPSWAAFLSALLQASFGSSPCPPPGNRVLLRAMRQTIPRCGFRHTLGTVHLAPVFSLPIHPELCWCESSGCGPRRHFLARLSVALTPTAALGLMPQLCPRSQEALRLLRKAFQGRRNKPQASQASRVVAGGCCCTGPRSSGLFFVLLLPQCGGGLLCSADDGTGRLLVRGEVGVGKGCWRLPSVSLWGTGRRGLLLVTRRAVCVGAGFAESAVRGSVLRVGKQFSEACWHASVSGARASPCLANNFFLMWGLPLERRAQQHSPLRQGRAHCMPGRRPPS